MAMRKANHKRDRRDFLREMGAGMLGAVTVAAVSPVSLGAPAGQEGQEEAPAPARPEEPQVPELPESFRALAVGASTVTVRIVGDLASPIRYVIIHGDEETAPLAAEAHLRRCGGVLIQLINPRKRFVTFRLPRLPFTYDFDPNRVFTRTGLEQNIRALNRRTRRSRLPKLFEEAQRFADQFLPLLIEPRTPAQGLIAVHNNGTSPRSDFSFETFVNSRGYFPGVEAMHYRRSHSPFNLFVVTDRADYEELVRRGLNVVLENSHLASDDGSLSVLCGKEGIRYANVETRMGEIDKQVEMLNTLREIWNARAKAIRDKQPE